MWVVIVELFIVEKDMTIAELVQGYSKIESIQIRLRTIFYDCLEAALARLDETPR